LRVKSLWMIALLGLVQLNNVILEQCSRNNNMTVKMTSMKFCAVFETGLLS
jgi:hypothetical protein